MEIVSGNKLQNIFHDHWALVYAKHKNKIRPAIIDNVTKMLACRSNNMGFHQYTCPQCNYTVIVHHSCKSRFCSSCGKKATDNWIAKNSRILPTTTWQHITFTIPSQFWDFFWLNRHLFGFIPAIAANTIMDIAKRKMLPRVYFWLSILLVGMLIVTFTFICLQPTVAFPRISKDGCLFSITIK